jgi:hypothetical protein
MMDFFKKKEKERVTNKPSDKNYIWNYFKEISDTNLSPYIQAITALRGVEESARDEEEFLYFLTSDIIYTALHTTVIEEMFSTLQSNHEYCLELISKFASDTQMRDELINDHTTNHLNYLANDAHCDGCSSCEGHQDLNHLLDHWKNQDRNYFTKLYLEVQTIFCFLEMVLFKLIPRHPDVAFLMTPELINETRNLLANQIESKIREA